MLLHIVCSKEQCYKGRSSTSKIVHWIWGRHQQYIKHLKQSAHVTIFTYISLVTSQAYLRTNTTEYATYFSMAKDASGKVAVVGTPMGPIMLTATNNC